MTRTILALFAMLALSVSSGFAQDGAVGAGRAAGAGGGTLAAGGSATGALLAWADATGAGPADDADTPAPRSSRLTANTALQTAQRARTPASGTLAGSTR